MAWRRLSEAIETVDTAAHEPASNVCVCVVHLCHRSTVDSNKPKSRARPVQHWLDTTRNQALGKQVRSIHLDDEDDLAMNDWHKPLHAASETCWSRVRHNYVHYLLYHQFSSAAHFCYASHFPAVHKADNLFCLLQSLRYLWTTYLQLNRLSSHDQRESYETKGKVIGAPCFARSTLNSCLSVSLDYCTRLKEKIMKKVQLKTGVHGI